MYRFVLDLLKIFSNNSGSLSYMFFIPSQFQAGLIVDFD
ncbi:hypothetical protein LEP1GSC065_2285 [Leptospira kirschneri serovar Sokoine str. RM1]|nr:hypothetical protein LEP1GSC065_2285 [Leptospira kirschneri serovar Sokoine str. RM1]